MMYFIRVYSEKCSVIALALKRTSSATDYGARLDLASILRANEFSSSKKANNLLFCSIVSQMLTHKPQQFR
jgi:hypothetical protein